VVCVGVFLIRQCYVMGARSGTVGSGTALQAGRSRVQFPMVSGHTMALGSTQPLTEMSTRNTSWE